jgi:hypothetical protein
VAAVTRFPDRARIEQDEDGGGDNGGDPLTEVEERVEGLHVEQRLGEEPAEQRTNDADDGPPAAGRSCARSGLSDDARDGAEHDPGDDAHEDLLAIGSHRMGDHIFAYLHPKALAAKPLR